MLGTKEAQFLKKKLPRKIRHVSFFLKMVFSQLGCVTKTNGGGRGGGADQVIKQNDQGGAQLQSVIMSNHARW